MTGKPLPPEPHIPWWVRGAWRVQTTITWPFEVRKLKREGFRRIGWRHWEYNGSARMDDFGRIAYEAYVADCGGKSIHGEDLPAWDGLSPAIRAHWVAAAKAVVSVVVGDGG